MNDSDKIIIKKIKRGFKLHKLIEVKTVGILLLKLLVPGLLIFKFFVIDFISGLIFIFIMYNLFYLLVSKSMTKLEENHKTIKRLFFDKFSKNSLNVDVKNYNDFCLKIEGEYAIGTKLKGKPISNLSINNKNKELSLKKMFLINNKYRFKTISLLELQDTIISEEYNANNINSIERFNKSRKQVSQDYYIFYTKSFKNLEELKDSIKSNKDLEIITSDELRKIMSRQHDGFKEKDDTFQKYDIYYLHNINETFPYFFHYNLKKTIENTGKDFVFVSEYLPYSIKEAEQILNFDIREIRDSRVNKVQDSEVSKADKLKMNMIYLANELNQKNERLYRYSSYFLIEKGLNKNDVKILLKDIAEVSGLHFSNVNIISKFIFKDRFKINPIKTFDIQSEFLMKAFENERCLLIDPLGKYLSEANNGVIIFNPFVEGKNRKGFSLQLLGEMGQGKTTLLKLLIQNNFKNNNKTIIMDVQGEYKILTADLGGQIIDPNNISINIMEVFINEYLLDDKANNNKDKLFKENLLDNIERIISFFKNFFDQPGILTELKTSLYEYYIAMYEVNNKDLFCSRNYTLKDFHEFIKKKNQKLYSSDQQSATIKIKVERLAQLELELESLVISDSSYFVNKTELDLQNDLICIDLHQLMDNEDESVLKKAFIRQLYSVIILRELKRNRKINEAKGIGRHNFMKRFIEAKFLAIIIDEEHEILNNEDEGFIRRLNSYTRLAPKCLSGLWGASHTIDDYNLNDGSQAAKSRKTLFDLRTYKIIMKQPSSTKETYNKVLIKNDIESNLTIDHIENTFKYDSGDFLFSFGNEVYEGYVNVNEELKPLVYRVNKEE